MYENSSDDFDDAGPSTMRPRDVFPNSRDKDYPHEEMWRRLTGHTWKKEYDSKMKKKIQMTDMTDKYRSKTLDDDSHSDLAAMEHIRRHILGQTGCGVLDSFHNGFDPVDSTSPAFESTSWMKIVMQFLQSKELKRAVRSWMNIPIIQRGPVPMSDAESDADSTCSRGLPAPSNKPTVSDSEDGWTGTISKDVAEACHSKRNFPYTWRDTKDCDDPFRSVEVQVNSSKEPTTQSSTVELSDPCNNAPIHSCHAVVQTHLPHVTLGSQSVGTEVDTTQVTIVSPVTINTPEWACIQNITPEDSSELRFNQRNYHIQTEHEAATMGTMRPSDFNYTQGTTLNQKQAPLAVHSKIKDAYTNKPTPYSIQTAKENTTERDLLGLSYCTGHLLYLPTQAGPSKFISRTTSTTSPESNISCKEVILIKRENVDSKETASLKNREGEGFRDNDTITSFTNTDPVPEVVATRNTQTSGNLHENSKLRHWGRGVDQCVTVTTRPAQTGPISVTQRKPLNNSTSVQTLLYPKDEGQAEMRNAAKDNCASQTRTPMVLKIPIKSDKEKECYEQKNGNTNEIHRTIIHSIIKKLRNGETGLRPEQISFTPSTKDVLGKPSTNRLSNTYASNLSKKHSTGTVKTTQSCLSSVARRRSLSHSTSREPTAMMQACKKKSTQQIAGHSLTRGKTTRETGKLPIRSNSVHRKLQRPRCTSTTSVLSNGTQTVVNRDPSSSRPLPLYEQRRMLAFLPTEANTVTNLGNDLNPTTMTPQQVEIIPLEGKRTTRKVIKNKTLHQAANGHHPAKITNKEATHLPKNNIVITKRTLSLPIASSLVHAQQVQIEVKKNHPITIKEIPSGSIDDPKILVTHGCHLKPSTQFYTRKVPCTLRKISPHGKPTPRNSRGTTPSGSMSALAAAGRSSQETTALSSVHSATSIPGNIVGSMRSACTSPIRAVSQRNTTLIPPSSSSEALRPAILARSENGIKRIKTRARTATEECQTDMSVATRRSPSACNNSSQLARHVLDVLQKQREYVDTHFHKLAETCETLISDATKNQDSQEQLKKVTNICRSMLRVTTRSPKSSHLHLGTPDVETKCPMLTLSEQKMYSVMEQPQIHPREEVRESTTWKQKYAVSAGCTRNYNALPPMSQGRGSFFCIPPNEEPPQSLDPTALPRLSCLQPNPYPNRYLSPNSFDKPPPHMEMMGGDELRNSTPFPSYGWVDRREFKKSHPPATDPWVLETKGARMRSEEDHSRASSKSGRPPSILKKRKSETASSVASGDSSESRPSSKNSSAKRKKAGGKSSSSTVKSRKRSSDRHSRKAGRRGSPSRKRLRSGGGGVSRKQVSRPTSGVASRKRGGTRQRSGRASRTNRSRQSGRSSSRKRSKSPKRSGRAKSRRQNQRLKRNKRSDSPSSKKLNSSDSNSSLRNKRPISPKKKVKCICTRGETGSSQETLNQEKCESSCASRHPNPKGQMTPCALRALRDQQYRDANAEDAAVAGASESSSKKAGSDRSGRSGRSARRGGDLNQDQRTCDKSCTGVSRKSGRESLERSQWDSNDENQRNENQRNENQRNENQRNENQRNGNQRNGNQRNEHHRKAREASEGVAGKEERPYLSARSTLLSVYLARRGFLNPSRVNALLSGADGARQNNFGMGMQMQSNVINWENVDQRGCQGGPRHLAHCISCRDIVGNSRFCQGAASHVPTDFPRWNCEVCRSDSFLPTMARCQIPAMNPKPSPPLKLVDDLGPMQGPLGRAPFAPPPILPCCAPPTNMGSVIGPCPVHGSVATTPEFIPLRETPFVYQAPSHFCHYHGNFWDC